MRWLCECYASIVMPMTPLEVTPRGQCNGAVTWECSNFTYRQTRANARLRLPITSRRVRCKACVA